ncbi:ABC transporter permease [Candidatus Omnitrophota bacterium]
MIEISGINKTYASGEAAVRALADVSLKIEQGEFVAIMGASGSGKSTLLHVLGFLDRADSGSYKFFDQEIAALKEEELATLRNQIFGFVFQQFHLLRRASAHENARLPLIYAGKRKLSLRAQEKLKEVGLGARESHRPSELSGGEQQRVAIARSLVNDPLIILADEPTGNLDTKSEKEIMGILKALNAQGKTVIMVTHEKDIADYADRQILMRDGKIISDQRKGAAAAEKREKLSLNEILQERHSSLGRIEFFDHIRQAFGAMFSNKMRSFLSMLGILIGVASVITMLALGRGAKESIEERLRSLGSNILSIRSGSSRVHGVAMQAGEVTRFTFLDAEAIRNIPLLKSVTSSVRGRVQAVYKEKNWNSQVEGVGFDYGKMRATLPEVGRWFTKEEELRRDKVALVGLTVLNELFGDKDPIGEVIKINRINFTVIGILPTRGASGWHDQDDLVIMPVTTAMYRVLGKDYLDSIDAEVSDAALMEEAEEEIRETLMRRHRLARDKEDSFSIRNLSEIQETIESTTKTMSILLGCIAAISLVVGGIGIMNIMLVSVTERTREIGLRKAVGARSGDILTQFLIESIAMTLNGGLMGVGLGIAASWMLANIAGWTTRVALDSVILAVGFSVFIGVFFGLWPAQKASRLNPIEALRYE